MLVRHEYLDVYQIPCTHNISKSKGKWEYCPVLNAGPENYKNMAVFKAGSWYCGANAARPVAEYRHMLLLYIFMICIRVYYNETPPSSPG